MWYSLDASCAFFAVLFLGARLLQMFVWFAMIPQLPWLVMLSLIALSP
jgi:hypothetical protein